MRRALITGGSSGIGQATAHVLARRGFDIGITYLFNEEEAHRTVSRICNDGRHAVARRLDVSVARDIAPVVEDIAGELGGLDVLVNNAGINRRCSLLEEGLEGWRHVLEVDLTGPFVAAQQAARLMIDQGTRGRIINVSSILDRVPLGGGSAYCAAKAGLTMLTRVMALELAEHGINVNAVVPGHALTPMNVSVRDDETQDLVRPTIPIGRAARAREVAEAISFLASPEASYVTGSDYVVDGGLLLVSGPEVLQKEIGLPPSSGRLPSTSRHARDG